MKVYANTATVTGGAYDATLDFGFQVGADAIDGLVRVTMSYEHLTSLIRLLAQMLEQYTEAVGSVPNPEVAMRQEVDSDA